VLDALSTQIGAAFLLALLGGAHCAGMCGGFVGALQLHRAPQLSAATLSFGYHAGRLTSYTLAGLAAGTLGGAVYATDVLPLQVLLLCAGSAMLLAIGASLLGKRAWLARLEPLGARLWRLIAPVARKVYPPRTRIQAYATGLLWGWIPCGMVYAALPLALTAGNALGGAAVMAAFGVGTLPTMLALDVAVARVRDAGRIESGGVFAGARSWLRPLAGVAILVFGVSGFAQSARIAGAQHPAVAAVASICHR
jgi:sulfite exporter TauE/SafE